MYKIKKIVKLLLMVMLVVVLVPSTVNGAEVSINGTVSVSGENAPSRDFPIILTQVGVENPIVLRTIAKTGAQGFSFPVSNLDDGDYYFELKEDRSQVPEGWTYDDRVYPVRLIVKDGKIAQCQSDGSIVGGLSDVGQEITVDMSQQNMIDPSGNMHKEVAGLPCYDHADGKPSPMQYRYITDSDNNVVIGAAYCIDYLITNITGNYSPVFDYNDFINHYTNGDFDTPHPHSGGKYEEFVWLVRNGFMSRVPGNTLHEFGTDDQDNNLSAIRTLTGVSTLSAAEAYSATQLAVWHFTNNITWVFGEDPDTIDTIGGERLIEPGFENVYTAYSALVAAADDAVADEAVITPLSRTLTVNFDVSAANYADGFYGPVKLAVHMLPEDMAEPSAAAVELTPETGIALYDSNRATRLNDGHELSAGDSFYVQAGSEPVPGTKLMEATVEELFDILDVHLLKAETWDVQAVMGLGTASSQIRATASLYAGQAGAGGVVFRNSYVAAEKAAPVTTPAATPTTTTKPKPKPKSGAEDMQTSDDTNVNGWFLLLSASVLIFLCAMAWNRRRKRVD